MATNGESDKPVKVIFRRFQGETVALFPEEPATYGGYTCACYGYGGHGSADPDYVIRTSRPSSEDEIARMTRELESAPYFYQLIIRKRYSRQMRENWQKNVEQLMAANWGKNWEDDLKGGK